MSNQMSMLLLKFSEGEIVSVIDCLSIQMSLTLRCSVVWREFGEFSVSHWHWKPSADGRALSAREVIDIERNHCYSAKIGFQSFCF